MSLSTLGAWYQYTGVTIITPCAATQRGYNSFIQSLTCPMAWFG